MTPGSATASLSSMAPDDRHASGSDDGTYSLGHRIVGRNASFWLDLRIALYTLIFFFTGERRVERAVEEAALPQQSNGHAKTEERKHACVPPPAPLLTIL